MGELVPVEDPFFYDGDPCDCGRDPEDEHGMTCCFWSSGRLDPRAEDPGPVEGPLEDDCPF